MKILLTQSSKTSRIGWVNPVFGRVRVSSSSECAVCFRNVRVRAAPTAARKGWAQVAADFMFARPCARELSSSSRGHRGSWEAGNSFGLPRLTRGGARSHVAIACLLLYVLARVRLQEIYPKWELRKHGTYIPLVDEVTAPARASDGVVGCGVVGCGVALCGVVWCGVVRYGAVRCRVLWRADAVQCGVGGYSAALLSACLCLRV